MQPCLSNYTIPRAVELKTIVLYCRRNARFPVHSSPPRKLQKCAARFLIRLDTTNDLPTFSPQKRNLEIGPFEGLLPIFGTKNRILKIGSCERAFTQQSNISLKKVWLSLWSFHVQMTTNKHTMGSLQTPITHVRCSRTREIETSRLHKRCHLIPELV